MDVRYLFGASILLLVLGAGCLGSGDDDVQTMSAFKHHQTVETRADQSERELSLVVVTAFEPDGKGKAVKWKFAYNDITSGIALRSVSFTAEYDGSIEEETGEPLSKSPIRNWSVDSTAAVSTAKDELEERGYVKEGKDIHINFIYLIGDKVDNEGCEWNMGIMPYYDDPAEFLMRIDGRSGEMIEFAKIKG